MPSRRSDEAILALVSVALLIAACRAAPVATSGARSSGSRPSTSSAATGSTPPTPSPVPKPQWPPRVKTEVAFTGFDRPVQLTHAGDGSGRAFVVELPGVIRLIQDGKVLPKAFLDVSDKVSTGGERGFFSIAFPPDYAASGRFYVDYTNKDGNSVISRYRVSASDRDSADPGSEQVLLAVDQPFSNHNGGQLAFGPDGYLYVGFGDGGSEGDPFRNGQNPNVLLGKILRLDVSGSGGYSVPRDNPFVGRKGYRPEIWDLGLRNPWRFSFDLANGDLYIADVGGTDWEEIDWESAHSGGRNYGWNIYEGTHPFPPGTPPASAVGLTMPVAEYGHDQGDAVMGAYVYRGRRWPALAGAYFYGDYGSGRLWALTRRSGSWESAVVADTGLTISGFGQDQSGELYLCDLSSGSISRIVGR